MTFTKLYDNMGESEVLEYFVKKINSIYYQYHENMLLSETFTLTMKGKLLNMAA
jgi:hypothetical protein